MGLTASCWYVIYYNYPPKERLIKLNNSAIIQMKILENDKTIKKLEILNKNLIDTK